MDTEKEAQETSHEKAVVVTDYQLRYLRFLRMVQDSNCADMHRGTEPNPNKKDCETEGWGNSFWPIIARHQKRQAEREFYRLTAANEQVNTDQ